jgi:hypothetical protein
MGIIKPKRTTQAGRVPNLGNLDAGEIAINLVDKKLYVRDTSNNVQELTTRTLESLDNLSISGPVDNQVLKYNNTTGKWVNSTITTPWTSASGYIYHNEAVSIGKSTHNPNYALDVEGAGSFSEMYINGFQVTGTPSPFLMSATIVSQDFIIPPYYFASSPTPIQVGEGATVTVSDNSSLVVTP